MVADHCLVAPFPRAVRYQGVLSWPQWFAEMRARVDARVAGRVLGYASSVAPRRLGHWLWQVSGLIAGPILRAVRVAFPDVSSGYDASVNEDAESPLRGSHGLSPCSLFSRPSLNRPGTSSRHMPFAPFRSTVTTEGMTVKAASRVVVAPCVASSGDRFRVTANGRPWRASAGVV